MADFNSYQFFNPTQTFVGGLAQGISQGKFARQQMQRDQERLDLQKSMLKSEQKYKEALLELKLDEERRQREMMERLPDLLAKLGQGFGTGGGGGTVTENVPVPEYDPGQGMPPWRPGGSIQVQRPAPGGFGGAGGIAMVPNIDPMEGKITLRGQLIPPSWQPKDNYDPTTGQTWRTFIDRRTGQDVGIPPSLVSGPTPQPVEEVTEGQGKRIVFRNPFGGQQPGKPSLATPGGGGAVGGNVGVQTELPFRKRPIPDKELVNYRNAEGNQPPGNINTPELLQKEGYKIAPPEQLKTEAKAKTAKHLLKQLRGFALGKDGIFTGVRPGLIGRIGRSAESWVTEVRQSPGLGQNVALYTDYLQSFGATFARMFGEVGVLTDADVKRAMGSFPKVYPVPDTEDVAKVKFDAIDEFIRITSDIAGSFTGTNVSETRDKIITALDNLEKKTGSGSGQSGRAEWEQYKRDMGITP